MLMSLIVKNSLFVLDTEPQLLSLLSIFDALCFTELGESGFGASGARYG